jgi:translocator protein
MNAQGTIGVNRNSIRRGGSWLALLLWIAAIVALGAGIGMLFGPDAWFKNLQVPSWNPPGWVFAPVWTTLYALMAISIWLVRKQEDASAQEKREATRLFFLQLLLNFAWTPIFFGLHNPLLALIEISVLWIVILWTAVEFGKIRPLAGYLFGPYVLWVSFALILNATIWLMNR